MKEGLFIVVALSVALSCGCTATPNSDGEKYMSKIIKVLEDINEDFAEGQIYDEMHKMANTKIDAEDGKIWGRLEITEERVDALIKKVEGSDFDDKGTLLEILKRWKKQDFSNCVQDHNYVWNQLGGTVGKACSLRQGVN